MEPKDVQFGYDLIRNEVLRDLLGTEHESIMYWIGKSIARKYPLHTLDEVKEFFERANWGTLTLQKEKKHQRIYELRSASLGKDDERCYQLEAGFLAEQIGVWTNAFTAANQLKKKDVIIITVESDLRDPMSK